MYLQHQLRAAGRHDWLYFQSHSHYQESSSKMEPQNASNSRRCVHDAEDSQDWRRNNHERHLGSLRAECPGLCTHEFVHSPSRSPNSLRVEWVGSALYKELQGPAINSRYPEKLVLGTSSCGCSLPDVDAAPARSKSASCLPTAMPCPLSHSHTGTVHGVTRQGSEKLQEESEKQPAELAWSSFLPLVAPLF